MQMTQDLLQPISNDRPCGQNLRYDSIYDRIRRARRPDQGGAVVDGENKPADHKLVITLASEALAARSKDLWIAVWLTDSLIQQQGFSGLTAGVDLIRNLIENFWDGLYPEAGDLEMRAAPLDWLGNYLELAKESSPVLSVRCVPVTESGLNSQQYQDSRGKKEGAVGQDVLDAAIDATPKDFYKRLVAQLDGSLESVDRLSALCDEKFGPAAPGFFKLRSTLEDVRVIVATLLRRKLEQDPDPVSPKPADTDVGDEPTGVAAVDSADVTQVLEENVIGLQPQNRREAYARIAAAAHYLRRMAPADPVSYLLLRALRWGELRAQNPQLDVSLLVAPPTELRTKAKNLAAAERWADLLEHTETAMATESGRAWLDLQRYSVIACERLGHDAAARAIKSELSRLLADFPALASATLRDDTGAANPETAAWLKDQLPRNG